MLNNIIDKITQNQRKLLLYGFAVIGVLYTVSNVLSWIIAALNWLIAKGV